MDNKGDKILAAHGVRPRILIETPYGLTIAILAAKGMGIGLVNPSVVADGMIGGILARPFEPAVNFRARYSCARRTASIRP
ncbi:LysR substrate-binding domain-containing protein [Mesorhizobium sp. M1378]|uniref:LysR substrate-binding domain-containing protein n=1 Tax=Mesorhizobium sp. M1378 TaxID=2957092 RepID=UPI0033383BBC